MIPDVRVLRHRLLTVDVTSQQSEILPALRFLIVASQILME